MARIETNNTTLNTFKVDSKIQLTNATPVGNQTHVAPRWIWRVVWLGLTVVVLLSVAHSMQSPSSDQIAAKARTPRSLSDLLTASSAGLERCDLALVNLLCAQGLPGAEQVSIPELLATLDQWTQRVNSETARPAIWQGGSGSWRFTREAKSCAISLRYQVNDGLAVAFTRR